MDCSTYQTANTLPEMNKFPWDVSPESILIYERCECIGCVFSRCLIFYWQNYMHFNCEQYWVFVLGETQCSLEVGRFVWLLPIVFSWAHCQKSEYFLSTRSPTRICPHFNHYISRMAHTMDKTHLWSYLRFSVASLFCWCYHKLDQCNRFTTNETRTKPRIDGISLVLLARWRKRPWEVTTEQVIIVKYRATNLHRFITVVRAIVINVSTLSNGMIVNFGPIHSLTTFHIPTENYHPCSISYRILELADSQIKLIRAHCLHRFDLDSTNARPHGSRQSYRYSRWSVPQFTAIISPVKSKQFRSPANKSINRCDRPIVVPVRLRDDSTIDWTSIASVRAFRRG